MSDEVLVEGVTYISSKRASEITTYAQDYIGQLARSKQIEARRIGGLWYVNLHSLESYKNKPEQADPQAAVRELGSRSSENAAGFDSSVEVPLSLEGKEYISASRASQITGYNQDYVGQLARGGKISAKQIGNRWFVNQTELISHKTEKDNLLAAVQASAVGLPAEIVNNVGQNSSSEDNFPMLRYSTEAADLNPRIQKGLINYQSDPDADAATSSSAEFRQKRELMRDFNAPREGYRHNMAQNIGFVPSPHRAAKKAIAPIRHKKRQSIFANLIVPISLFFIIFLIGASLLSLKFSLWEDTSTEVIHIADLVEKTLSPDLLYQR